MLQVKAIQTVYVSKTGPQKTLLTSSVNQNDCYFLRAGHHMPHIMTMPSVHINGILIRPAAAEQSHTMIHV